MTEAQNTRSIWEMAAKSLVAGVVMCIVALTIAGGANWLAQTIALEQGNAKAALDAANLSLQNTQSDRARLEENLQMFDKLKQSRFAHTPDRLAMLEALEVAAADLRKSTLVWELGAQEKLKPLTDDKSGEAVAQLVRISMKLGANTTHEEEWVRLLSRLQGSGAGYFTLDGCLYERKVLVGIDTSAPAVDVKCSLSWLYVVPESTTPKPP